ncbi:MAG TPA: HEAT repeat domain-containing protein, partial [Kofleriaceae bacterium]|nr:HEAT repeat domain-containing protein [Kofleriaceae bacterium]
MWLCAQRWALRCALSLVIIAGATGCPSDPYDPDTWIKKLEDPESKADLDQGVKKLVELHDPKGIPALGKVWEKFRRSDMLQGMVTLAEGYTDSDGKVHGPYWDKAVPFLVTALQDFDLSDARSIEQARAAAMALGEAKDPGTVQELVKASTRSMPKLHPGQNARIAAIRALGGFPGDQRAADTLIKILETEDDNSLPQAR